jgi:hypothetical protein
VYHRVHFYAVPEETSEQVERGEDDSDFQQIPIPARIGVFSPLNRKYAVAAADSDATGTTPTPPRVVGRFSFIARAKAALTSVFGNLSVQEPFQPNKYLDGVVDASASLEDVYQPPADDLLAFFSPGTKTKPIERSPRPSPRPLPDDLLDLALARTQ